MPRACRRPRALPHPTESRRAVLLAPSGGPASSACLGSLPLVPLPAARPGQLCQAFARAGSDYCDVHHAREDQARVDIIQGVGGNAGALLVLLDAARRSAGMSWRSLTQLAQSEGLGPAVRLRRLGYGVLEAKA